MTPKRGDRVAPPAGRNRCEVRFASNEAAKGWGELCNIAADNTLAAWEAMRTDPSPVIQAPRHHRLRGVLAFGHSKGKALPQWQIEVTGGGRIWYLHDEAERTCWVTVASPGHPKATD